MNDLFLNVLTASFHGGIVIAVVLVLRLVLKKAPKKFLCMLWLLAGLRLLMPFEIESQLSLQPETAPVTEAQWQELTPGTIVPGMMPPELVMPEFVPAEDTVIQHESDTRQEVSTRTENAVPAEIPSQPQPQAEQSLSVDWEALVPVIWAAVACALGIYSLISYLRLKFRVREAVKCYGGIWECDRIETAFILGFVKPRIYIPMGMSRQNRRHILAHERAHMERKDHWIKLIGFVTLAIHWFNPLVWVAYILLCKDIEMACDERVVQSMALEERKSYSAALLSCSTNRAHFAACPVAFGEVSVKSRIKSVLNYRKPGFWVTMVSIAAIVFVSVCLMTSPAEASEVPDSGENELATVPVVVLDKETGYASTLEENEILAACESAIESLKARESYVIRSESTTVSSSDHYGSGRYSSKTYRYGNNILTEGYGDGTSINDGGLTYDGRYAMFYGDKWVWNGTVKEDADVDAWLNAYSPTGKTVSNPQILSGDTVSLDAVWTEANPFERDYSGTLYFTFHDDGTVAAIRREHTYLVSEIDGGGEVRYTQALTVMEESDEEIDARIQAVANETITEAELEEYRRSLETIDEIPSNKTDYDKDFALGAGSKQWKFFNDAWHVRIGAEDATPNGLTLTYAESGEGHKSLTADEGFWLEQLVDGKWVMVPGVEDKADCAAEKVSVSWTTTDRYAIDWTDSYGTLDHGFYRIGRYHTVVLSGGETETAVCYAKFRLYDPNMDALLEKCKAAFDALLNADSYHIYTTDWMTEHDYEYYMTEEVWKHGADYLQETRYPYRENSGELWSCRGAMWRDGVTYDLEWAGNTVSSTLSSWKSNTYMDEVNFTLWTFDFEWYDSKVEEVIADGNQIRIIETYDFNDDYEASELLLTFDDAGNLTAMRKAYLPTRTCAEKDKVIEDEMVVLDFDAEEIAKVIDSQDLSKLNTFSWAEDQAKYPAGSENVRTEGFVNTTGWIITTTQQAIDRALKDCTLPAAVGLDPGTNVMEAFYDEDAKIWKVEFTASWDSSIYQAVYLSDHGITQMVVTLELEVEY